MSSIVQNQIYRDSLSRFQILRSQLDEMPYWHALWIICNRFGFVLREKRIFPVSKTTTVSQSNVDCIFLNFHQVAWVRVDTQTILSIHHNLITQNNRISLTHNDHRSWYLHIKEVEEDDRGWYMCQINTGE